MLFKLSKLNSNLALTLDYLNPALNNSAQLFSKKTVFPIHMKTTLIYLMEYSFLQLIIEKKRTPSPVHVFRFFGIY